MKEGFKPSQGGRFGPGVYLTNSFKMACRYGDCFVNDEGVPKKMTYLFVNKVRQTDPEEPPRKLCKVTQTEEPTKGNSFFAMQNSKPHYRNGKKLRH